MKGSTKGLYDRFYFSRPGFVNGTAQFHELCREVLPQGGRILEVGAGASNQTTAFLSTIGRIVGLDVSDEVKTNTSLVESSVFDGGRFPFPDASFDGCASNYVIEHIENPGQHFAEVSRVLRPGGNYVFRTPNLLHYVAAGSMVIPSRFHITTSKRMRGLTADDHDPWRTFYRANTTNRIRRLATQSGLSVVRMDMIEKEPSYGRASSVLFYLMMAYERVVNSTPMGAPFRANILGVLRKA